MLVQAIVGGNVPTEVRQRREGVTSSADNLCVKHLSKSNSAVSCNDFSDEASSVDIFVDGFNFLLIVIDSSRIARGSGPWLGPPAQTSIGTPKGSTKSNTVFR